MKWVVFIFALWTGVFLGPISLGQESDDVASLKRKVAELTTALENATAEIDALNAKLDELTSPANQAGTKKPKKSVPLSERLQVGTVLEGDYRSAVVNGIGRMQLTVRERDGVKMKGVSTLSVEGKDLGEGRWEGTIRGNRLTLTRVGSGNKVTSVLELKGDALEGFFIDSQGNRGSVGLRLPPP